MSILDLPNEIITHIISNFKLRELIVFRNTCRRTREIVDASGLTKKYVFEFKSDYFRVPKSYVVGYYCEEYTGRNEAPYAYLSKLCLTNKTKLFKGVPRSPFADIRSYSYLKATCVICEKKLLYDDIVFCDKEEHYFDEKCPDMEPICRDCTQEFRDSHDRKIIACLHCYEFYCENNNHCRVICMDCDKCYCKECAEEYSHRSFCPRCNKCHCGECVYEYPESE